MSYIYSESYIRQKLRRLEEVNEYNKAKLAMYAKKKSFMSKNEYERYKKILFGTDYRSQRESLANSKNNDPQNVADKLANERHGESQQGQQQQQLKNEIKLQGQVPGNILQKGNKKQSIRTQQQGNQNNNTNNNAMSKAELQHDATNKEGTFQTPKQQQFQGQEDPHHLQQGQDIYQKQNGVFNTAQFKSTLNSSEHDQLAQHQQFLQPEQQHQQFQQMNQDSQEQQQYQDQSQQQHGQSNSEQILHQTYNYEDSVLEQTQLLRNIRIIEMEKRELQSQLEDLSAKENFLLNSEITYRSNKKRSIYEDDHLESISSVQNPLLASKSFRESLQSSPTKIEYTKRPMSSSRRKSYYQLQKNIGLDFNSQWEMLEKWENVGSKPISEKLTKGDNIGPLDWISEERVCKQSEKKPAEKDKSSVIYPQRIVHSFLPDENWETQFNKIGKTYEERQMIVDSEINYFGDFLGRNPNPRVHVPRGKNNVNKCTIDRLSDDIEQFMRYTRFSQSLSSNSFSPFQKKRGLYEIPEEQQSHETTLNY